MKKIIDMTQGRPVIDVAVGGYMDTTDALGSLLSNLFEMGCLKKRQKVLVLVSNVGYHDKYGDDPFRFEQEKVYTFGYLCRLYERWTGEEFSSEKFEEKSRFKMMAFEKDAEKRSAWVPYIQYKQREQAIVSENNYHRKLASAKNTEEIEEIVQKRKKETGPPQIYIGG